jgi:hypothetical protein
VNRAVVLVGARRSKLELVGLAAPGLDRAAGEARRTRRLFSALLKKMSPTVTAAVVGAGDPPLFLVAEEETTMF